MAAKRPRTGASATTSLRLVIPTSTLAPFLAASLVLLVIPGPAVLYIVARSSAQGVRAGMVSVAGVHVASLTHVLAAVAGLSAIVVASATAFTAVKWLGGAYLVYLGVRAIAAARRGATSPKAEVRPRPDRQLFVESFVVNLLNPKVALFFLAFLPQFVSPHRGSVAAQLLLLGLAYVALGVVTDGLYAAAGGTVGRRALRAATRDSSAPQVIEGVVLVGLGLLTIAIPQRGD